MKKAKDRSFIISSLLMFVLAVVVIGLIVNSQKEIKSFATENNPVIVQIQKESKPPIVIEVPYTEIIDQSIVHYHNRLEIPIDDATNPIKFTDVNGISGFYIDRGMTHYTYIEGHLQGKQLMLYALFYSSEEYGTEELQNAEDVEH